MALVKRLRAGWSTRLSQAKLQLAESAEGQAAKTEKIEQATTPTFSLSGGDSASSKSSELEKQRQELERQFEAGEAIKQNLERSCNCFLQVLIWKKNACRLPLIWRTQLQTSLLLLHRLSVMA